MSSRKELSKIKNAFSKVKKDINLAKKNKKLQDLLEHQERQIIRLLDEIVVLKERVKKLEEEDRKKK